MKTLILVLVFICMESQVMACEIGKTYRDYNLNGDGQKATSEEVDFCHKTGDVFYVTEEGWKVERKYFKDGMITTSTGYTWCGNENPPPKGNCPYVLYRGHRWYPNYHGVIYVYEDGREVK